MGWSHKAQHQSTGDLKETPIEALREGEMVSCTCYYACVRRAEGSLRGFKQVQLGRREHDCDCYQPVELKAFCSGLHEKNWSISQNMVLAFYTSTFWGVFSF